VSRSRKTVVLALALLSIGLRATVGYPAALAGLEARQCCARRCPHRSSVTPDRCKCCHSAPGDERLFIPCAPWPSSDEPVHLTSPLVQPPALAIARMGQPVDARALGPPLFLTTHHIQR